MLSIIIPAHNEERRIGAVLEQYSDYFDKIGDYEIIVVCNGCTDKTSEIVSSFKGRNVRCIESPQKLGKGGAIIKGFKSTNAEYIGFVDCDESVPPGEFENLLLALEDKGYDCAIASRRAKGATILAKQPLIRRISSKSFNLLVRVLFDLPFKDTQCGAKVFRGECIRKTLPQIVSKGFEFDVELLWRLKRMGYGIKEVPIVWKHEPDSKFNLSKEIPNMLINISRIRFSGLP